MTRCCVNAISYFFTLTSLFLLLLFLSDPLLEILILQKQLQGLLSEAFPAYHLTQTKLVSASMYSADLSTRLDT